MIRYSSALMLAFAVQLTLCPHARSQDRVWSWEGATAGERFGSSVDGAGDVDRDGQDDLVVGAPEYGGSKGRVYVRSGATGDLIGILDGEAAGDEFGWCVAGGGDVDGDGIPELLVGAPYHDGAKGKVYLYSYSGFSWNLVCSWVGENSGDQLGICVAWAGSTNDGDVFTDIALGARFWSSKRGRVYIYSSANLCGPAIQTLDGPVAAGEFGRAVSGAGDVDGDGFDDLVVGAPVSSPGTRAQCGIVYVYSGRSWGLLSSIEGEDDGDLFGWSVAGAGDVDADAYGDIIVGARREWGDRKGRAYVYVGPLLLLRCTWEGSQGSDYLGWAVSSAGDFNDDGYDDLIVAAPEFTRPGYAHVYSGATCQMLYAWEGNSDGDNVGMYFGVAGAGNVNGDRFADVIIGESGADGAAGIACGKANVYAGAGLSLNAEPNRVKLGNPLTLTVREGKPGGVVALFFVDVNGILHYLAAGTFDSTGTWLPWSGNVPSSLQPGCIVLRAYGIDATGRVASSNNEPVCLQ